MLCFRRPKKPRKWGRLSGGPGACHENWSDLGGGLLRTLVPGLSEALALHVPCVVKNYTMGIGIELRNQRWWFTNVWNIWQILAVLLCITYSVLFFVCLRPSWNIGIYWNDDTRWGYSQAKDCSRTQTSQCGVRNGGFWPIGRVGEECLGSSSARFPTRGWDKWLYGGVLA